MTLWTVIQWMAAGIVAFLGLWCLGFNYLLLFRVMRPEPERSISGVPAFLFLPLAIAISPLRLIWWLYPLAFLLDPLFYGFVYVFLWKIPLHLLRGERI